MMEYRGYLGHVEFDDEGGVFHGEVVNIRDVITFQGRSVAELKQAFRDSVHDYLEYCKARGESPDRPFSGQFVTRIPPDLHRQISAAAQLSGKSLNAWVAEQLRGAVRHLEKTPSSVPDRPARTSKRKATRIKQAGPRKSKVGKLRA